MNTVHHNVWVLFERADDLEGAWVAHCLDWDIATFGRSLREAMDNMLELVVEAVVEEATTGEPRTRACDEDWERLRELQATGSVGPTSDFFVGDAPEALSMLATQVSLTVVAVGASQRSQVLPTTWARSAEHQLAS